MTIPFPSTLFQTTRGATCPLRARVCPDVAFPWVQCHDLEWPVIHAWRANEDDDRDYFDVLGAFEKTQCIAPAVGISFLKRGTGYDDPPERFPYRCQDARGRIA